MMNKPPIFYYSGTHWDREWYQSYQGFRYALTSMMDDLIAYLQSDPQAGPFHLDGQTIILEDYLEIRPEMRDPLTHLLQNGRILAGPWYCAPDEHLISGESLIRNLQKGFAICARMQFTPWRVSNLCDGFGHMAQMPQLLQGFGLDAAIVGRGTNEHSVPTAFVWEAPDGSRVTALRPPDQSGYGSFAMDVCGQIRKDTLRSDTDEAFQVDAKVYVDHELVRADGRFAVIWDAMDHEPIHHEVATYLKTLQKLYPEANIHIEDLYQAFQWVKENLTELPVWRGEMLEPAKKDGLFLHLLIHKLSSRQSIKAAYDQCEDRLIEAVEPICAWMKRHGLPDSSPFLELAWEYLLKNSIHDTICGCSIDRVHEDTKYRFAQVNEICDVMLQSYQNALSGHHFILTEQTDKIVVLNPWPVRRDGVCSLLLPFTPEYPTWHEPFGYEEIAAFTLTDETGAVVPYAIKAIHFNKLLRGLGESRLPVNFYEIYADITFEGQQARTLRVDPSPKMVRQVSGIAYNDGTLENEFMRISIQKDGTVTLLDKCTGKIYPGLCELADDGEIGDGWNHVAPVNDVTILGGQAEIAVMHSSEMAGTVRVIKTLRVPTFREQRGNDDPNVCDLQCVFSYTLFRGERNLRVDLTVKNTARDHRLKLHLPTGVATDQFVTADNFVFLTRDVGPDVSTYNWKECDKSERPMRGIAFKRDKERKGLAFVAKGGLHECACVGNTLEITLLRSFADTFSDHEEIGGQELFDHEYTFALVPLDSNVSDLSLLRLQQQMKVTLPVFPSRRHADLGTMELQGEVCVSAFGENFVRVYNPADEEVEFSLHSSLPFATAGLCDLHGNTFAELKIEPHVIKAVAKPMKIVNLTFAMRTNGEA